MSNLNPPKVDTPQQNVSKESKESFTVESHIPLGVVATNISEDGEHNFWRISSVQKKSQAEKIGIKAGNFVYSIAGMPVSNTDDLNQMLQYAKGKSKKFEIVLFGSNFGQELALGKADSEDEGTPIAWQCRRKIKVEAAIPSNGGVSTVDIIDVRNKCRERVRNVCQYFCLLPLQGKSPNVHHITNLVCACLANQVPTPMFHKIDENRDWLLGLKPLLKGPQPWMATRKFIFEKIEQMYDADDILWLKSKERQEMLSSHNLGAIKRHLIAWKTNLGEEAYHELLHKYATAVWKRFTIDYTLYFSNGRDYAVLHKLTERYVHVVSNKLAARKMCPEVPTSINGTRKRFSDSDKLLKTTIMFQLKKIQHEIIPFSNDLEYVCNALWERLNSSYAFVNQVGITPTVIEEILNDLEMDFNFLTYQNQLCIVKINRKLLLARNGISSPQSSEKMEEQDSKKEDQEFKNIELDEKTPRSIVDDKHESSFDDESTDKSLASTSRDATELVKERKAKKKRGSINKIEMGSRVYAEYTNGDYYWGRIGGVLKVKGDYRYFVHFEDGDILDGIRNNKLFTEEQYRKIFEIEPPPPDDSQIVELKRKERLLRRRSRNDESDHQELKKIKKKMKKDMPVEKWKVTMKRLSLSKLRKGRCRKCVMCMKADCEKCAACRKNLSTKSTKLNCFQKICCKFRLDVKAQPAIGYPDGWTFIFEPPNTALAHQKSKPERDLRIYTPCKTKLYSVEKTRKYLKGNITDFKQISQSFLVHTGIIPLHPISDHFLIGKNYCHEWSDTSGQNLLLFGIITKCWKEKDEDGDIFTVKYSEESVSLVNSMCKLFSRSVPPFENISSALAWGGCVYFEQKKKLLASHISASVVKTVNKTTSCKKWLTPDMRNEEIIRNKDGIALPRLTVAIRGFKLVFSVKTSKIPEAGYGVFVKCTSLLCDFGDNSDLPAPFEMQAGELFDLGIYAPLLVEDKKQEAVFKVKNFIFSGSCEEWCFNSAESDYYYDITDDLTGEVHKEAKRHIPMYVNEDLSRKYPPIHADLDPEGNVHLLFGIAYNGNWDEYTEGKSELGMVIGGEEVELFMNYGDTYENIRVRKSFSSLSQKEQKESLESMSDLDSEFVTNIEDFTQIEIHLILKYLMDVFVSRHLKFEKQKKMIREVRRRAMMVTFVLKSQVEKLMKFQQTDSNDEPSTISIKKDLHTLLRLAKDLIQKLESLFV